MEQSTRNAIIGAVATVLAAAIAVSVHFLRTEPTQPVLTIPSTASIQTHTHAEAIGVRYRVIIHLPKADPHTFAEQVRDRFADAGYDPEIRDVAPRLAPKHLEVRYFRDTDRHTAHEVAALMKAWGLDVRPVPRLEYEASAPLNQVEVWLPPRPVK